MHIALINQPWNIIRPPVQSGSIAIWTDEVARGLSQAGHRVTVYGRLEGSSGPEEQHAGVAYHRVPTRFDELKGKVLKRVDRLVSRDLRRPPFSAPWYYRGYIQAVARQLKNQPADVVHIQNFAQFLPVVRQALPDARLALHMHSEWLAQIDPVRLEPWLQQADLILGCSDYVTAATQQAFPHLAGRCHTVYNGVDTGHFSPLEPQERIKAGLSPVGQKILFVGRISPEKGLHVLLEAFEQVRKRCPGATLQITGPDSMAPRDFLVTLSRDPNMRELGRFYDMPNYQGWLRESAPPGVTFTGPMDYGRVVEQYRSAAVLANPSFSETFGMTLIEAMACEVPTVSTAVGGAQEVVVDGQTGFQVKAGEAGELADALVRVLEMGPEPRQAMGAAGRGRVLARYAWPRVVDRLKVLYHH